ncbi:molybdopterin dinucleotide-binding region [Solidesulfovibrio fructosivorans JJ]]|uniref:Molybdopterin dinucleotide-binding region n=1 Tax=Solidesulfovibrio fructosivorans JJ] TaxID=596151 RepID=E1JTF3_SOLFR|nr:molybdopterin dinucleotide binding domain-containing protein [Solidesulfovibrio fructosivorans]EFL52413.1 molybdopterin dinucleotide-binding region [Solidesulfovibrio fructosivorans JJ]]
MMDQSSLPQNGTPPDQGKRDLLKKGAVVAGLGLFAAASAGAAVKVVSGLVTGSAGEALADPVNKNSLPPEYRVDAAGQVHETKGQRVAFNQCWGCTTFCGVRLHIDEATDAVTRVAGNPYNPLAHEHHFAMDTPVEETLRRLSADKGQGHDKRSTTCGRGAAMLDASKNPFRITRCLKRAGKRGEGKWKTIPFEQLVAEVVDGGDLFGEGHVDGLRAIREAKGPANPAMPEFGPQSNRLLLTYAVDDGRETFFYKRFGMQAFGTKNFGKHGAYCGLSFRIGSGLFMDDLKKNTHIKPDFENCEFAIFWGTAPSQAGNPFNRSGRMLAAGRSDGKLHYAVVDPVLRMPMASASRDRCQWVPILPGMDSALAMGMMRWIFDNERFDKGFLSRPTLAAAKAAGEAGFCNATHLVRLSGPGAGHILMASDMGLAAPAPAVKDAGKPAAEAAKPGDAPMVMGSGGKPVPAGGCPEAALFYRGEVRLPDGSTATVATALTLLREEAMGRSLEEYATYCGVPVETMTQLARELTAHGKRAAVDVHGGMMSTSGGNATFTVLTLNTLIGNINAKGGIATTAGSFHAGPALKGPRYDLENFPGEIQAKGFPAIRCRAPYQKSTEFKQKSAAGKNPYPSEQPWYPLTPPNMPGEHLLSHANGSPFTYKCWINWTGNVIYGHGGLKHAVDKHLRDPADLPLIIGIDTFHNETNAYADYLVPDPCMYEVWGGFSGAWAGVLTKMSTARWPAIEPRQEKSAAGEPVCMELFLIEVAKRLGLPGFGDKAIPGRDGTLHPLNTPQDYYLRLTANVAWFKGDVLPSPSDRDVALSGIARILPDIARVLPPEERGPVAYVYSRGGRFAPYGASYAGDAVKAKWEKALQIYNEEAALAINSQTGRHYSGTPRFLPPRLTDGRELRAVWTEKDYPLLMTSFKSSLINSYAVISDRLLAVKPINMVMVHTEDAKRLGVSRGDLVRMVSPAGSAAARVVVGDVVMPGVVAVEHGFGHTALGAADVEVDGKLIRADRRAAAGFSLNDLTPPDPTRKGASTLLEHEYGCSARQGIPIRLEKV